MSDIAPDTLYRLTDTLNRVREERDQHAATIGVLTTERDALIEEVARLAKRLALAEWFLIDGDVIQKMTDGWRVVLNADAEHPVERARFDSADATFIARDEHLAREAAKDDDAEPAS